MTNASPLPTTPCFFYIVPWLRAAHSTGAPIPVPNYDDRSTRVTPKHLGHYASYLYRPSAGPSAELIIKALHQAAVARPTWNAAVQPERVGRGSPTNDDHSGSKRGPSRPESCRSRRFTPVRRNELYYVVIPGRTLFCVLQRNRCAQYTVWESPHCLWGNPLRHLAVECRGPIPSSILAAISRCNLVLECQKGKYRAICWFLVTAQAAPRVTPDSPPASSMVPFAG